MNLQPSRIHGSENDNERKIYLLEWNLNLTEFLLTVSSINNISWYRLMNENEHRMKPQYHRTEKDFEY